MALGHHRFSADPDSRRLSSLVYRWEFAMRPSRAVCRSERGMVATAHYLGSGAALDILKRGGSAVDAAICAAATLGVVLPHMIGVGGDASSLIYEARSGKV